MTIACPRCAAENPDSARFCRQCGGPLAESRVRSTTRLTPLLEKWRRLSRSMTRKEVRALLGEPRRVEASQSGTEAAEVWVYEYESADEQALRVTGQVHISPSESRVVGWQEPEWERLR